MWATNPRMHKLREIDEDSDQRLEKTAVAEMDDETLADPATTDRERV
jgi:hypothetical protein